jgi:hypothetical protein
MSDTQDLPDPDDAGFDAALVRAAMALAAEAGWQAVSPLAAARAAGLAPEKVRARVCGRAGILLRLGRMADQAALSGAPAEGTVRDRLFELLMRRLDVFQAHRAGVLALLRALPSEPGTALLLACATERSMGWMLDAAGVSPHGLRGMLRVKGLTGVWLWTIRAWERDESADMAATMAALDQALARVEGWARYLSPGARRGTGGSEAAAEADEAPVPESPPA